MFYNKNNVKGILHQLVAKEINTQWSNHTDMDTAYKNYILFQAREHLEKTLEKSISFNKSLTWEITNNNLHLATTAEEFLEVYQLRSDIYTALHYNAEFQEIIEGLNFDDYDHNAGVVYTKTNDEITGTCRLIFDSSKKLPTEEKVDFKDLRKQYKNFAEVSRLMVKNKQNGLNLEFKNLTKGIYLLLEHNNIDLSVSVIRKDHFKLYSKFGGFKIEQEMQGYGELESEFVITSWNHKEISDFFKKAFL